MAQNNELPDQLEFWNDYYRRKGSPPSNGAPFPLARYALRLFKERDTTPILDLACGLCNDAIFFAKQRIEVYAVDFSQVVLEKVRKTLEKEEEISNLIHLQKRDSNYSGGLESR